MWIEWLLRTGSLLPQHFIATQYTLPLLHQCLKLWRDNHYVTVPCSCAGQLVIAIWRENGDAWVMHKEMYPNKEEQGIASYMKKLSEWAAFWCMWFLPQFNTLEFMWIEWLLRTGSLLPQHFIATQYTLPLLHQCLKLWQDNHYVTVPCSCAGQLVIAIWRENGDAWVMHKEMYPKKKEQGIASYMKKLSEWAATSDVCDFFPNSTHWNLCGLNGF
jgi:hypothetical protein